MAKLWSIAENNKHHIDAKRDMWWEKDKGNRFERRLAESRCDCDKCVAKRKAKLLKLKPT